MNIYILLIKLFTRVIFVKNKTIKINKKHIEKIINV